MANLTREFIAHVKLHREKTGEILKDAIKHVERLILSGQANFSKYEDPDIISTNVKPALKLMVGEVVYIGYENQYSAIVSSVDIQGAERKIYVSLSCLDNTEKQVVFSFDDFVLLSPLPYLDQH